MQLHRSFIIRSFALLTVALLPSATGCGRSDTGTTIEEVRDWPNAYMGKVITAVGEVQQKYASGSFVLDGKGTWWDDNILVVVPREQMLAVNDGSEVRVTGEIERLVIADIEREYGLDLESDLETTYRDAPILVARNITVLDAD